MKISLIRKDKQNITHLSTKTLEDFIDRIKVDTKTREVERYREFIQRTGSTLGYTRKDKVVEAYPMVELRAESNGTLVPASHNGVVVLHVSGLHVARDFAAVKAVARMLPMTLAVFEGADGQSMELLVSIGQSNGHLPADEAGLVSFYKAGYDMAFRIYGSVLPKTIERRAAEAMSHFPMTLDSEPYFNAQATPICVDAQIAATITATVDAPLATIMPQTTDAAQAPANQEEEISQETQQLIDFLTTRYMFRYNTVMGYTEYRQNNGWSTDWQVADENVINGMTIEARLAGLSTRDKDVRRYVRSNLIRHFNPTEDYLWPLYGHWDKRTDYIAQLARTVPC
ncbi:MAG: hypothetical protein IJ637_02945, partial [Prevotella sp.]|nr:hypothetical protein [Prevotella sp.]